MFKVHLGRVIVGVIIGSLLIVLTVVVYINNSNSQLLNQRLNNNYGKSIPQEIKKENFCDFQKNRINDYITSVLPSDYIKKHKHSFLLEKWKSELLKKNNWTETYFNDHVRIQRIDESVERNTINPQYIFIIDWAIFEINGDTVNKENGDVKNNSSHEFTVSRTILPCEKLVAELSNYNSSLNPEYMSIIDEAFIMSAYGIDSSSSCSTADINMSTNEIIPRNNGNCRID